MNTTLPPSGPRAYRVERFVGRGGFGCVYLAQNLAEGALGKVALKVMDEGAAEEWVARFFHEAQVLSRLSGYPAFVKVNAVFKMERRFCIDMEYVPGLSLDELIERGGPVPLAAALQITRAVATALDAAYNRARDEDGQLLRVLHRDLKPGNLRVSTGGTVRVLDFGLARSELRGVRPETLRALPATLAYMAPERYQFRASFGHAADLYALGMTLYELLAGRPFLDTAVINPCLEPDREELEAWTTTRLEQLAARRELPPALLELLAGTLRFEPEARLGGADIDRTCRQIGGLELEDRYQEWVEGPLQRLLEASPKVPRVDPWSWVGTMRRSDQERDTPPARGSSTETFLPEEISDRAPTALVPEESLPPLSPPTEAPPPRPRSLLGPTLGLGALALIAAVVLWPRPTVVVYRDGDGDGVGAGPAVEAASGLTAGYAAADGDCDDQDPSVHPGAPERCDGLDQDCDGQADQGLPTRTFYADTDGDGRGGAPLESCQEQPPAGAVATGGDCDDQDPADRCAEAAPVHTSAPSGTTGSSEGRATPRESTAEATPTPKAPQGEVTMLGAEATAIRLRGPESATLHADERRSVTVGDYTATVEFDGGDYEVQVTVREGATATFDCTARRMGSPCQVR